MVEQKAKMEWEEWGWPQLDSAVLQTQLGALTQPATDDVQRLLLAVHAGAGAVLPTPADGSAAEGGSVMMVDSSRCAVVLQRAWDALHTGDWKDVPAEWRRVYMAASYYSARTTVQALHHRRLSSSTTTTTTTTTVPHAEQRGILAAAFKTLDLGLMLGDATFRSDLLGATAHLQQLWETLPPLVAGDGGGGGGGGAHAAGSGAAAAPASVEVAKSTPDAVGRSVRALTGNLPPPPRLRQPPPAYFYNECMVAGHPAVLTHTMTQ
jgi:hypothetical protein